jgi:hypothetical protein
VTVSYASYADMDVRAGARRTAVEASAPVGARAQAVGAKQRDAVPMEAESPVELVRGIP